jgi:hypothetical protein
LPLFLLLGDSAKTIIPLSKLKSDLMRVKNLAIIE